MSKTRVAIPEWNPERDRAFLRNLFDYFDPDRHPWAVGQISRRSFFRIGSTGVLGSFGLWLARRLQYFDRWEDPQEAVELLAQALALGKQGIFTPAQIASLGPTVRWYRRFCRTGQLPPAPHAPTWETCRFLDAVLSRAQIQQLLVALRQGNPHPWLLRLAIRWATGDHRGGYLIFGRHGRDGNLTDEFTETLKISRRVPEAEISSAWSRHDAACALGRCFPDNELLIQVARSTCGNEGAQVRGKLLSSALNYYDPRSANPAFVWQEGLRQMRAHIEDPLRPQWFILAQWLLQARRRYSVRGQPNSADPAPLVAQYTPQNLALIEGVLRQFDPQSAAYWRAELEPVVNPVSEEGGVS